MFGVTSVDAAGNWQSNTIATQVYQDVDAGESRPDRVRVYQGRPVGVNVHAILQEHDWGSLDDEIKDVQDALEKARKVAGATAVVAPIIPGIGTAVAGVAAGVAAGITAIQPYVADAMREIGSVLDLQDDPLGDVNLTFTAKQMVVLASQASTLQERGVAYEIQTPLLSRLGASYKLYFAVDPA
jgi:hypothetical protein